MSEEVKTVAEEGASESQNFIHQFIQEDIAEGGRCAGMQVHTRFPPSLTATCISATAKL